MECNKCSYKRTFKVGLVRKYPYFILDESYEEAQEEYKIFWCSKCSKLYNLDCNFDKILINIFEKKEPISHHCSKCGRVLQNVTDELGFTYNKMSDVFDMFDLEKEVIGLKTSLDNWKKERVKDDCLKTHLDKIDDGLKDFIDYFENFKKEKNELKILKCPKCKDGYLKVREVWIII
ncbi:hypothetical protein [uncultured Ilyobacter sp.]|uniref:hypothetical protein n=1 Tax=uncultured Ilyobacter sp. TaxID=544433 RepID=UPI00374A6C02